jgi:hypothetical protein
MAEKRVLYSIRFDRSYKQYNAGETAGFPLEEARTIVTNGAGVHVAGDKVSRLPGAAAPVDPAIAAEKAKAEFDAKAKAGAERKLAREKAAKAEKPAKPAAAAKPAKKSGGK